jgi:hypothetical protein
LYLQIIISDIGLETTFPTSLAQKPSLGNDIPSRKLIIVLETSEGRSGMPRLERFARVPEAEIECSCTPTIPAARAGLLCPQSHRLSAHLEMWGPKDATIGMRELASSMSPNLSE